MDFKERLRSMFGTIKKDILEAKRRHDRDYDAEVIAVVKNNCKDCFGRGYVRVIVENNSEDGYILRPCKCVKWKIVEKKDEEGQVPPEPER